MADQTASINSPPDEDSLETSERRLDRSQRRAWPQPSGPPSRSVWGLKVRRGRMRRRYLLMTDCILDEGNRGRNCEYVLLLITCSPIWCINGCTLT